MAYTPTPAPTYTDPNVNYDEEYKSAYDALDPSYSKRIDAQSSAIPLYQQELQNYKDNLANQQQQGTTSINRGAQVQTGNAQAGNAARGVFDSSVRQNQDQNIEYDRNTNVNNLISDILSKQNTAQNTTDQKVASVKSAIADLLGEEQQTARSQASASISSKKQAASDAFNRAYQAWSDQNTFGIQKDAADTSNYWKNLEYQASQAQAKKGDVNQQLGIYDAVFKDASGNPTNDQNTVYDNIQRYAKAYQLAGGNPEDLWGVWRNLKYGGGGVPASVLGGGQSAIDAFMKTGAGSPGYGAPLTSASSPGLQPGYVAPNLNALSYGPSQMPAPYSGPNPLDLLSIAAKKR